MVDYGWLSDNTVPSTRILLIVGSMRAADKIKPFLTGNIGILAVCQPKGGGPRFDKIYMCVDLSNWGDSDVQRKQAYEWWNMSVLTTLIPNGEIVWLA